MCTKLEGCNDCKLDDIQDGEEVKSEGATVSGL